MTVVHGMLSVRDLKIVRLQISFLMQINAMLLGARKIFVNTANISIW